MAVSRMVVRSILSLRERGFYPEGILDIGSYIGEFALTMRNNFKEAHILMVDPLHEMNQVCTHIATRIGNAEFKEALLGNEEKEREFHLVDREKNPNLNLSGSSVYKERNDFPFTSRKLQQTTLSKLLEGDNTKYQLVKLAVAGAELEILKGMGKRLNEVEAIVMKMNLLDYNAEAPLIGEVLYGMEQLGFVLVDLIEQHRMGTEHLFQVDGLFLRPDSAYRLQPPYLG